MIEEDQRPLPATLHPERLQRLLEISTRLSSTLHLNTLLDLVMDVATELTHTEAASILLLEQNTGQLRFAASTGGMMDYDLIVPLNSSIAGWVVRHGRSLIIDDVQSDTRFYANVDADTAFQTHDMLAVPLVTQKGIIGCLEVINKHENAPYTQQDIALMEALASQSAVAILNAHLFEQSDLLAEIMHELKTPLMAITTASELLARPDFPTHKHAEVVGMIQRESQRLARMTKEFVDLARLESGRLRLERQPLDLKALINDVVHLTQAQAAARGITLTVALDPALPGPAAPGSCLQGDADRLKQALLNLISNGIKYNRENGRLAISAQPISAQPNTPDQIAITIADTGHGIDPQDLPHLFDRFYRIPSKEGQAEGSGLGLTIAQKIISEHGGQIQAQSKVDVGTTFIITLPLSPA